MVTAASDTLSVLNVPAMNTRLIDTVSATGIVDITVAKGRVRVETAFVAIPTRPIANIATARLSASLLNSDRRARADQATPYMVSTVMNVAVQRAALNCS